MDHLAAPMAPEVDTLEGWTVATALARHVDDSIGHLVLCDPFRHPVLLAKIAASSTSSRTAASSSASGGVGTPRVRTSASARTPATRAAKLRETLEILGLMFDGEPFDYPASTAPCTAQPAGRCPCRTDADPHRRRRAQLTMPLVARLRRLVELSGLRARPARRAAPLAGNARISTQHPIGLAAHIRRTRRVSETVQRRFGSWGGVVAGTAAEVAASGRSRSRARRRGLRLQFSDFGTVETIERFMRDVVPAVRAAAG